MELTSAARGENLVRTTGVYQQDTMTARVAVVNWLVANRTVADRCGECEGGCDEKQMIPHETHGYAVCPLTYLPCKKRRLSKIIQLLGIVNGKRNSNATEE